MVESAARERQRGRKRVARRAESLRTRFQPLRLRRDAGSYDSRPGRDGTPSMSDDDKLMVRIQEGDGCAFEELVEQYQGPLIGFFFRNTRDHQLSEDLTQETLLRVFNQAWDYLPTGRFRGWVYRIARNLLVDNIRRQSHDALVHAFTRTHDGESDAINRLTAN